MSKPMNNLRYQHPKVIEHLASQYVLGTLTEKVHSRVAKLALQNKTLEQAIHYWQTRLVTLDHQTDELPAQDASWQAIAEQLDMPLTMPLTIPLTTPTEAKNHGWLVRWFNRGADTINGWLLTPSYRYVSAFSIVLFAVFIAFINPLSQMLNGNDPLSYVAVLTQPQGQAHLVASTYGESQKLVVNIINAPDITKQQSLELWVVSKTDHQARSLGLLPTDKSLLEQQLTNAQWRLIKDSESLIVTVEEAGGSAIGEPSEMIVSRGLCVRLEDWNKNV